MKKIIFIFALFILSSSAFAGLGYKSRSSSSGIAVPIKLNNDEIYNLVVNVEFLSEPYDSKPYDSDEYEKLIERLEVEWSGIAIQVILDSPSIEMAELSQAKKKLELKIDQLVVATKKKYEIRQNIEVVYSIYSFYLVKPE